MSPRKHTKLDTATTKKDGALQMDRFQKDAEGSLQCQMVVDVHTRKSENLQESILATAQKKAQRGPHIPFLNPLLDPLSQTPHGHL